MGTVREYTIGTMGSSCQYISFVLTLQYTHTHCYLLTLFISFKRGVSSRTIYKHVHYSTHVWELYQVSLIHISQYLKRDHIKYVNP